jgi:ribosomal protein S18 acetylase RimI-like enzyme
MHLPFHIRTATPQDYPAIIALLRVLAAEEGGACHVHEDALAAQVASANPPLWIWVAEHTGEPCIVACALAYGGYDVLSATRGLHLSDVVVASAMRGRGIGTALLARLAKEALQDGMEWISWTALRSNHDAQRFYRRIGGMSVDVQFMAMGRTTMQRLQSVIP